MLMRKYFFTGLVTLLPLAVTIWMVDFFVRLLTNPFMGIVIALLTRLPIPPLWIISSEQIIRTISQITILITLFLITLFIGFVARRFFFYQVIKMGDRLLHRIPLVNKVYKTSKEIVVSLFGKDKNSFKQCVMVPFPYSGAYSIGLISRDSPKTCSEAVQEEMVSVFIPATPNPATGFLVMSKKSELIYLDIRSEDAVKYVVSCGVILPKGKKDG